MKDVGQILLPKKIIVSRKGENNKIYQESSDTPLHYHEVATHHQPMQAASHSREQEDWVGVRVSSKGKMIS